MPYSQQNAFADQQAGRDLVSSNVQQFGRYRAGRQMQQGDSQAAASELYGAGDLEGGQQLQQQDQAQAARLQAYQEHTQAKKSEQAQKTIAFMKDAAKGLLSIPAPIGPDGKPDLTARREAYANVIGRHLVEDFGVSPDVVQQAADHLDDNSLHAFGPDLDKQFQGVNLGGGGYGSFDPRTNEFKTLREPDPRFQSVGDGATLYDPTTRQPVYTNPKNFAPQRPRAAGGGGGAQGPAAPATRQIGGRTYYKVNGEWYDNPEGR